jgi:hypothetical protein
MDIVHAIGEINFRGNVIPHNWFGHLRRENGKANLNATVILSEIVYWYRPTVVKDEATGEVLEERKKFKADKLQRNYQSFADQFGLTKRQAKAAIKFLVDKGVITIEFRHLTTPQGTKLFNVLYLEPVIGKLKFITNVTIERHTYDDTTLDLYRSNGIPPTIERHTNTDSTTEITTRGDEKPPPRDYLGDVLEAQDSNGKEGVADPSQDVDNWLQYRDKALAAYKELTSLYPDNEVGKPAIGNLAGEADFDLQRWRDSISSCRLHGVNPRNIACMIDTYRAGGDYGEMWDKRREQEEEQPDSPDATPAWALEDWKPIEED